MQLEFVSMLFYFVLSFLFLKVFHVLSDGLQTLHLQDCLLCSCGSCGYELNLSSSSRNTSKIGSKYDKSIKKGIISFFYIDESRFTQVEVLKCVPNFIFKHSWGLLHRKTKLLCRNCGNHIGDAYEDNAALVTNESDFSSNSESSSQRKYDIRIRCLQPSSAQAVTPVLWCMFSQIRVNLYSGKPFSYSAVCTHFCQATFYISVSVYSLTIV